MTIDERKQELVQTMLAYKLDEVLDFNEVQERLFALAFPRLTPLPWGKEYPISENVYCPVTGDMYIIGRTIGHDKIPDNYLYKVWVMAPRGLTKTLLAENLSLQECRGVVELRRNNKITDSFA